MERIRYISSNIYFWQLPLSCTTTVFIQLILKRGLVAVERRQKDISYQSTDIEAGIRIGDLDNPNVLVPLNSSIA